MGVFHTGFSVLTECLSSLHMRPSPVDILPTDYTYVVVYFEYSLSYRLGLGRGMRNMDKQKIDINTGTDLSCMTCVCWYKMHVQWEHSLRLYN